MVDGLRHELRHFDQELGRLLNLRANSPAGVLSAVQPPDANPNLW
jgi:hypothetical protein